MILVDTNVWRELGHENGDKAVRNWGVENAASLVLSAVVLGEIRFGLESRPDGKPKMLLADWVNELETQYAESILPFDRAAAQTFGAFAAMAKKRGQNPGDIDIQIAAQASANGMAIATRNVKDFEGLGVELINPWEC